MGLGRRHLHDLIVRQRYDPFVRYLAERVGALRERLDAATAGVDLV